MTFFVARKVNIMACRRIVSTFTFVALLNPAALAAVDEREGIVHSIAVSLKADPNIDTSGEPPRGTINLVLRISAHSQSADFAGEASERFDNIDVNRGTPFHIIWTEDHCHERRGLLKIWVQRLSGFVSRGDTRTEIFAEPRQHGIALPQDELKTEQHVLSLKQHVNESGLSERILRARSSKSPFQIEVKLITRVCSR